MNITFRQLRLFLALADTGSVSAAAKRMHVTQSTASDQLREITLSAGLPLYEVISKKVYLTDLGKELAQTARRIGQEWDGFVQLRDATQGLTQGRLRISAVSTAKYFVPRLVGEFCKRHPAIDVSLEILNRDGIVTRLRDNRDELYIMSMPPDDIELTDCVFMDNPLVVIAPKSHPLANRKKLPLGLLQADRFILREPGSGTRIATDRHFSQNHFLPQIRLELGSNEAIREAVAGGLGVGVISKHALRSSQSDGEVTVLNVRGFPIASRWHMVYPANRRLSPVAQAFYTETLTIKSKQTVTLS
jgi:DNA-binding transcriptional LysR family regulator